MTSRLMQVLFYAAPCALAQQMGKDVQLANGVLMPAVGFGTWELNDTEVSLAVQNALAAGFRHIDCAHNYNNQVGIGAGLAASGRNREEVFITSKVPGCGIQGVATDDCFGNTLKFIKDDFEQLSRSGFPLKYLDLLLIHFPPCMEGGPATRNPFATPCYEKKNGCTEEANCQAIAQQWQALELVYKQGYARAIGVSDYCSACFECLGKNATVAPMLNNLQYHIGMGPDPQGVRTFAERRSMPLMAWSPLGHGGGFGGQPIYDLPTVADIGKNHNKSGAQVALKWILSHNVMLTTMSVSPQHLAQDLDLFSWELTPAEVATLDSILSHSKYDTPSFLCNNNADPSTELIV